MTAYQRSIMEAYRATGRIAIYHPRKGTISLNGFRAIPVKDAITKMRECVNAERQGAS